MTRFRFTLRRMMVAVAVVGVLLGAVRLLLRRSDFLERALYFRQAGDPPIGFDINMPDTERSRRVIADMIAAREARLRTPRSLHYQALARKYERAARFPWLPVAPDPPEPK